MRSSLYGFSSATWRKGIGSGGIDVIKSVSIFKALRIQCFSAKRVRGSQSSKVKPQQPMEEDPNAFYVVRKGDIVGIYKSLSDCQAQVSSSVCDPSVSVYKGYSFQRETEEYLVSRGLKGALYSMHATDLREDIFGTIVPYPFRQPDGLAFLVDKAPKKTAAQIRSHEKMTCILEFDGASKGNPGLAGAGAILRTVDGGIVSRLREGLGIATCNVAEYRGLILGMKFALKKGFKQIQVQGDSNLVCLQKFNSGADAEANVAAKLPAGEVQEVCGKYC